MWHYSETRHVLITYHVLTAAYCYQPLTASLQPSNSLLVSGQGADGNCGHAASAASIGNCSSARVFFKTSWPWKGWILWWHAQKESFVSGKKLYSKHFAESHGDNLHSQPLGYNAWCLFHTKSHAPTKILRNKSAVCWGNHLTASWKWTFPLSRVWQARQASNMKNQAILILTFNRSGNVVACAEWELDMNSLLLSVLSFWLLARLQTRYVHSKTPYHFERLDHANHPDAEPWRCATLISKLWSLMLVSSLVGDNQNN